MKNHVEKREESTLFFWKPRRMTRAGWLNSRSDCMYCLVSISVSLFLFSDLSDYDFVRFGLLHANCDWFSEKSGSFGPGSRV